MTERADTIENTGQDIGRKFTLSKNHRKIGIISGGGALPAAVAASAKEAGYEVHLIGIEGETDPSIAAHPHSWMQWGQIGRLLKILKTENCNEVVIIGSVRRPNLRRLRIDLGFIRNLPLVLGLLTGGDDSVLSGVVRFFERHGYMVRGAHEVAPGLLVPAGLIAGPAPNDNERADIRKGMEVVAALGALDVGQAAVVARGYVLAVEAAEGTDEMLRRCGELRQWGNQSSRKRIGVMVKAPKPGQEIRVDMPALGPETVRLVSDAGLQGIAIRAGAVLMANSDEACRIANKEGIFIYGLSLEGDKEGPLV